MLRPRNWKAHWRGGAGVVGGSVPKAAAAADESISSSSSSSSREESNEWVIRVLVLEERLHWE
jgi:hypothetical protein